MSIDKNKIVTQDETGEPAAIDQVEQRVEAEMKQLGGSAKKNVGESLQDEELVSEGERLQQEGEHELKEAADKNN